MAAWLKVFSLNPDSELRLSTQIARVIVSEIRRGRLRPGERLPGTRTLAKSLLVSRNTAETAYEELESEGWITRQAQRGSFVNIELESVHSLGPISRGRRAQTIGFSLYPNTRPSVSARGVATGRRNFLQWDYGIPDLRIAPTQELGRAYRSVLNHPKKPALLYDRYTKDANASLEVAVASMLASTRGISLTAEEVVITHGSQMALYLCARTLLRPGDRVVVEHPGYPGAWDIFRRVGAEISSVPVDGNGLQIDALESLLAEHPIRAVFVTPHHQFPTTSTLSADRRMRLLQLAKDNGFAILEDDYDHEFHYTGPPVLPLASMDRHGVVIYIGSFSKIFAPGLRLGYLMGPAPFVKELRNQRAVIDLQGQRLTELSVAELLESGALQRHWRRSLRIYRRRRSHLEEVLSHRLGDVLEFELPSGGMAFWVRVREKTDIEKWASQALGEGLSFRTASIFFMGRPSESYMRLGFARLNEDELEEAARRLRRSMPTTTKT